MTRLVTKFEHDVAKDMVAKDRLHSECLMIVRYAYVYNVKIDESKIYEAVVRHRKEVRCHDQARQVRD